eukprot:gene20824-biopygen1062
MQYLTSDSGCTLNHGLIDKGGVADGQRCNAPFCVWCGGVTRVVVSQFPMQIRENTLPQLVVVVTNGGTGLGEADGVPGRGETDGVPGKYGHLEFGQYCSPDQVICTCLTRRRGSPQIGLLIEETNSAHKAVCRQMFGGPGLAVVRAPKFIIWTPRKRQARWHPISCACGTLEALPRSRNRGVPEGPGCAGGGEVVPPQNWDTISGGGGDAGPAQRRPGGSIFQDLAFHFRWGGFGAECYFRALW